MSLSSRLCDATDSGAGLVAFGREGERSARDLRADVASLAARLPPMPGARLLLHCDDAYAFAVALLAVAQLGARAVLPPSRQPGALRRLAPEVAGALLDAADACEGLGDLPCWHPLLGTRSARRLAAFDRDAPCVEMFTSGTTGAGKPVTKALRHLEDEVAVLEERFGAVLGAGTRILATVAPQHLYGLLFRVLWPLSAGRPFLRSPVLQPEELAPHLEGGAPFALASTPAALRRIAEKDAWKRHAPACRAIFSSGGPLPADTAARLAESLGAAPFEVYGSTETGGVAVRQQTRGGEPWRPLPGVAVAPDPAQGGLAVTSRFVSAGEPLPGGRARFVLADRVAFDADGGFELLGRSDRTVKIGEKRLALPDMEARLLGHPAVQDVALVPLERAGETRVGAAVVPTAAGRELFGVGGRRALAKALAEHLEPDFDRVLLPRAWRVVESLPHDAQGKTAAERLLALFDDADTRPAALELLALRREPGSLDARLRVPEDLAFLEGHYPGHPVVAGVVQVHFVLRALEDWLEAPPRLERLEALKFRELLLPGQELRLRLDRDADGAGFAFTFSDPERPGRVFSSGRGRLRDDP